MNTDQLNIQPTTNTERRFDLQSVSEIKGNPYKNDFKRLYGLPQSVLGRRANSLPTNTLTSLRDKVSVDLLALSTSIIPFTGSTYSLGAPGSSFFDLYVDNIYTSGGTSILGFKTFVPTTGTAVIADQLADTLTLSSTDGSIIITGSGVSDTLDFSVDLTDLDNTFLKLDGSNGPITGNLTFNGEVEIDGALNHDGTTVGFFGTAPITKPTEITDELTTITHTAPGTPDYAIQDLTNAGGFGFVTKDEGNTVLSALANAQVRIKALEDVLVSLGLLSDAD